MPVYNSALFLQQSIQSILSQTFTDFEFIIINDGSVDNSDAIIKSFQDVRIRYFSNHKNMGIVASLNKGLDISTGKYIARMDADDISLPNRFDLQFYFMENNKQIAFCGAQALYIDEYGKYLERLYKPIFNDEVKIQLLFNNIIIHPSTFFRADILKEYQYSIDYEYAEDYYLFAQIALDYEIVNLKEILLLYRTHSNNTTKREFDKMITSRNKVYQFQLGNLLGHLPDDKFITQFSDIETNETQNFYTSKNVLESLIISNKKHQIYNSDLFKGLLYNKWFLLLRARGEGNLIYHFFKSPLFSYKHFIWKHFRKLFKQQFFSLFGKKY